MWVVRIIAILVVLGLGIGVNLLCYRRGVAVFAMPQRGRRIFALTLFGSVMAILLGRWVGGEGFARSVAVVGWSVQAGVLISAALLLPTEAIRVIDAVVTRLRARFWAPPADEVNAAEVSSPVAELPTAESFEVSDRGSELSSGVPLHTTPQTRRAFLYRAAAGGALAVGAGSSVYGTFVEARDYVIEERVFPLPGLPRSLEGYTLVQLSDLHFGPFVGRRELERMVEMVRRAQPDAVVITGDVIDSDPAVGPLVGRLVQRLRQYTRDGVFVIPGNHDYYAGVEELIRQVTGAGGRMLTDGNVLLGDGGGHFALLGVDDVWAYRYTQRPGPDLQRALQGVDPEMAKVLLCHNPSFFPEAAPYVDLQLSGHTHGGQISLFINPAEYVLPHGFVRDAYQLGDSSLYVNRGIGTTGPPCRIGSAPEITKVVLTSV